MFLKQTLLFLPKFEFYMKNAFFWCIYCWYSSKIAKLEIFRNFLVKLYYNGNFAIFFCFLQKKFWKWLLWTGNDLSFQENVFLELCDAPELS